VVTELEDRVAALEGRLVLMEDQLAIYQLVMSYGPAVDSGSSEFASRLWIDTGFYDWDPDTETLDGAEAIAGMVRGADHQAIIHQGSAHVVGIPWLQITGDAAVGTCYSGLYRWDGTEFRVWRMTANRWEFAKEDGRWRVAKRTNRRLDGNEDARAVLRQAVEDRATG
jgi:hypothetical protein